VLGDDLLDMGGRCTKGLDTRKQWGVGKEGSSGREIGDVTGGSLTAGAVLYAAAGSDSDILVGVNEALFKTVGVREDDTGRNILLVVEVGEQR
jgi:hypothetical protein